MPKSAASRSAEPADVEIRPGLFINKNLVISTANSTTASLTVNSIIQSITTEFSKQIEAEAAKITELSEGASEDEERKASYAETIAQRGIRPLP